MGSGKSWIDGPDFEVKKDQNDEKEIMEELMSQTLVDTDLPLVDIEIPLNEFFADYLLVPMSQVSLKEVEIKELREENEKIKSELARSIEEKNKTLNDKSQLQKKFSELKEKSIGKAPLQGVNQCQEELTHQFFHNFIFIILLLL